MRHLGIDYGSKRIGLALSDEGGVLAFPYSILLNDTDLLEKILKICEKENVSAIIIGESHNLAGKANKIMGSIEMFKRNLEAETDIPISFQKEFMTTVEARAIAEQMRGEGGKKKNNERKVAKSKAAAADAAAAALILQRYLDKKNIK